MSFVIVESLHRSSDSGWEGRQQGLESGQVGRTAADVDLHQSMGGTGKIEQVWWMGDTADFIVIKIRLTHTLMLKSRAWLGVAGYILHQCFFSFFNPSVNLYAYECVFILVRGGGAQLVPVLVHLMARPKDSRQSSAPAGTGTRSGESPSSGPTIQWPHNCPLQVKDLVLVQSQPAVYLFFIF